MKTIFGVLLAAASIGQPPYQSYVGIPEKEIVHLTPELLVEISDRLIKEDIAEVDIDPETFDLPTEKPKQRKKDALDEIQFISERESG